MSCNGWREVLLEDIAAYSTDKIEVSEITIKNYISTTNMVPNKGGIESSDSLPSTKRVNKSERGDTLISNIRPYFKKIWYSDYSYGVSSDVLIIRPNKKKVYSKYLYYFLSQDRFFDFMVSTSRGTKMPRGDKDAIIRYPLALPPYREQISIANFFKSLDEKIEVNSKMNETLEEMAQAIFKHWFVDFEFPNENGELYKTSGGKFVESELGMIPEGFKVTTLDEIITISSGKRPKKRENNQSPEYCYPLIGASSTMGYVNEFLYNEDILIIGRVGTHGIVQRISEKCWPSDNTLVMKSDFYNFVYQNLCNIDYSILNRGSTQPLITQKDIKNYKIILPDKKSLKLYEDVVQALFKYVEQNNLENVILSQTRDTLLPKLMSGEIRIPDAEKEVEACLQKNS